MAAVRYSPHLVGFLDVLGFSEIVMNPRNKNRVEEFYDICLAIPQEFEKVPGKTGIKTISMSDSIVIALELPPDAQNMEKLAHFLIAVGKFQYKLAKAGFFIRGGITYGDLQFDADKKHVVGAALVKAVNIEKKIALFPRVVVDVALVDQFNRESIQEFRHDVNITLDVPERPLIEWTGAIDDIGERPFHMDLPLIVDTLACAGETGAREKVAFQVNAGLKENLSHYAKYRWFADYILASSRQQVAPYVQTSEVSYLKRLLD